MNKLLFLLPVLPNAVILEIKHILVELEEFEFSQLVKELARREFEKLREEYIARRNHNI